VVAELKAAGAVDAAAIALAVNRLQPAIRVDKVGQFGQRRQVGKGHQRGLVGTGAGLVGPLAIVMRHIGLGDPPGGVQVGWAVQVETFFTVVATVSLHEGIQVGPDLPPERIRDVANTGVRLIQILMAEDQKHTRRPGIRPISEPLTC
jgi:hypothetical protein